MTISEAIKRVDTLKPNQYSTELKIEWLSVLDAQIYNEVYLTHDGNTIESFDGYNDSTSPDTQLLVPAPFGDDIYLFYLQSAIDRENGETAKHNQSATLYNNAYLNFQNFYNRTHMPKTVGIFTV